MKKKSRLLAAMTAAAALTITVAGAANAANIGDSSGPLTKIEISEDLNCDVEYLGDAKPEFYAGNACGTLVAAQGVLYGPQDIPFGPNPRIKWTKVSQTEGGSGTAGDPYTTTTVVTGGALSVTQVDTYIAGQNSYRSSVAVTNTSDAALDAVVYRAADCYLQDSDEGYGEHNAATGAVLCRAPDGASEHSASGRIEEFVPLTTGSSYLYSTYRDVWDTVATQDPLPNEVRNGDEKIDNGMGLSWSLSLAAGETRTVGVLTNFSPLGEVSLPSSLTPAASTIAVGEGATLSASVKNPNLLPQTLSSLTVTLPANVDYVAGTSTVLGEPAVSSDGRTLTYTGSFPVADSGQLDFKFGVRGVSAGSGDLSLSGAAAGGAPVATSSASITVKEPVTLGRPVVTEASCDATGDVVAPTVELPADTDTVTYALVGEVVAGGTVTVEATPRAGDLLPESAEGWTINAERTAASMEINLEPVDCEAPIVAIAPVDPAITQATCEAGPKVTLPKTDGVTYSGVPATLKAGEKFTLKATPAQGYELAAAKGWTLQDDGTASKEFTLDASPKCPTDGTLAATGVSPLLTGLLLAGLGAVGAGAAVLVIRRKRNI